MADNQIMGRAKKYNGTAIDYVSIFNWIDGKCIAQVVPNESGEWVYSYSHDLKVGLTYVANGCEPITHGAYDFAYVGSIPTDYILYYDFNGDVLDKSINVKHGIKTGNANFVEGRKAGTQCLEFVSGCVKTPTVIDFGSDKVTLSFWMKTNQQDIGTIAELTENYGDNGFMTAVNNREYRGLDFTTYEGGFSGSQTPILLDNTVWQHVFLELDRNGAGVDLVNIYINNELKATANADNVNTSGSFKVDHLYIGSRAANSQFFKGSLQDVRIYNRILTEGERTALFNE